MKRLLVAILLVGPAAAQPILTEQQVLGSTIGNLFTENARLAVELQKAQAKVKELEAKECK